MDTIQEQSFCAEADFSRVTGLVIHIDRSRLSEDTTSSVTTVRLTGTVSGGTLSSKTLAALD